MIGAYIILLAVVFFTYVLTFKVQLKTRVIIVFVTFLVLLLLITYCGFVVMEDLPLPGSIQIEL